ncbi:hypothetical protein CVS40_6579 [Lucilia cuprina]|nr:hypothetical protein CVS40_6579 [Lucilia cuprina]
MRPAYFYLKIFMINLVVYQTTPAPKRWNLEFYSLTCSNSSNTIKTFDCNFNQLAPSHYNFTTRLIFNKNLDKQFSIRYFIDVKPHFKKDYINFINIKINACDAIRTNYEIPLLKTLMLEMRRTSNIPYQCPFKKDVLYEFKNLSVTDKYLLMSVPNLNFTNGFELYESSNLIGSFITKGGITSKT